MAPVLPLRSVLTVTVLEGVNSYQTVCARTIQNWGSPGSVVVPARSPESVNGSDETVLALAKLSLAGAARTGNACPIARPPIARTRDATRTGRDRRLLMDHMSLTSTGC